MSALTQVRSLRDRRLALREQMVIRRIQPSRDQLQIELPILQQEE